MVDLRLEVASGRWGTILGNSSEILESQAPRREREPFYPRYA